ncbi:DUF418 domain-containing protein [Allopontixanthobacter sediminis]|uniref:DUF418 domain-containing protein n=1 Tax=Allopontixanthobacter sediminis TaxID=1689985 RepID=A0A845B4J4_9SPHN|nr:DUF418 domain-containing protein [Allopontixanthobacter sediminis]MXP45076.1 DUF418 domain-containing protein [Allopontixanthobacter sediminis]
MDTTHEMASGASTPDEAEARTVPATDRLVSLDFIRGIAVMGILWANIVAFGQPWAAYMYPAAFKVPHGEFSDWLWVVQFVLIDGKMRGLFTLLFGAGMMLFMEKAWARGATRSLQARRLFWLFGFGLIHFYFIWRGDILVLYSVVGFVAMACLRWKAKTQLVIGLLGYAVGAIMFLGAMFLPYLVADTELGNQPSYIEMRDELASQQKTDIAEGVSETAIIRGGSYADYVGHNFTEHGTDPFTMLFIFGLETFPLMLIGMALYRMGLFGGEMDRRKMRLWGWAGLIVGSALTLPIALWAMGEGFTYWGTLAAFMGVSPLPRLAAVLGLLTLLALWAPTAATGWLGERVTAAGRMAFSNYLGTSIVMLLVFHGWAGGLYGQLGRPELYLVVAMTWALMLLWSKPWLERFRYGPLEWLWRCLTYGKLFALRR